MEGRARVPVKVERRRTSVASIVDALRPAPDMTEAQLKAAAYADPGPSSSWHPTYRYVGRELPTAPARVPRTPPLPRRRIELAPPLTRADLDLVRRLVRQGRAA